VAIACYGWQWALLNVLEPITVAARCTARTVFVRSNTGIVGSNPTRSMDVCVRLFCIFVVLCVRSGLVTGWSPVQGVLLSVYGSRNLKSGQGPKGCRAIERDRYLGGGWGREFTDVFIMKHKVNPFIYSQFCHMWYKGISIAWSANVESGFLSLQI
jgi:hypothetical protein